MASIKQMIEQAAEAKKKARDGGFVALRPFVAPLHAQWMERSEAEQAFTPAALQRGMEVLSNQHKVKRDARFSASGLGQCKRRQLFSFAGVQQAPPNLDSADIMRSGTAAHFWIMLEGLSAGWLAEAETFYMDPHYRVGGTLDGIITDGSIWEYKSVASTVFNSVSASSKSFAKQDKPTGPKFDHLLQCDAYDLLTGAQVKSLFYQDRNFGQYAEYRLGSDSGLSGIRGTLISLLEELNGHEQDNTLPPMFDGCESRAGQVYNECPYRFVCPLMKKLRP